MNEMYHYESCGLPNIYLQNGFKYRDTQYGRTVAIHDLQGLHRVIGLQIAECSPMLSGEEIRFLRTELDMPQATLAQLLGVNESTVRNWESGRNTMPRGAEVSLRVMYKEYAKNNESFTSLIKKLAQINRDSDRQNIVLEETDSGWRPAA